MSGRLEAGRAGGLFLALVMVAVAARLAMAWLLPPLLDVYYYDTEAARALLGGLDPYGFAYSGIPSWLATPNASNVFAYLPGVVEFLVPFGALWDVRLGLVFADLLVAFGVYSVGGAWARRATLLFLLLPFTALFSTSYPNNTLVSMGFLGPAIALWLRGRGRMASALFGVALASSQFVWLLFPLFLFWAARSKRLSDLVIGIAVAAVLTLPFLIWDWSSFTYDTLFFQFTREPRAILSPAAFGVNVNPTLDGLVQTLLGTSVPLPLRVALTVGAMALAARKARDIPSLLLNGALFMVLVTFILPNDLSWWYLELPFQMLVMWFAATRRGASAPPPVNP